VFAVTQSNKAFSDHFWLKADLQLKKHILQTKNLATYSMSESTR